MHADDPDPGPSPAASPPDEQPCLRALTGPLAGSVYAIGKGLRIGRGSDCEVQLVTPATSRSHACILLSGDRLVLVDMLSANGTWIGDRRVERQRVEVGDEILIGGSSFVVDAYDPDDGHGSPPIDRVVDGRAQAPTHRLSVEEDSETATAPDAAGIVASVLAYRNLRPLVRKDGDPPASVQERFAQLRRALYTFSPTGAATERHFECQLDATIRFQGDQREARPTRVLSISVDGATVMTTGQPRPGRLCWLSLSVLKPSGRRWVVVTARVSQVGDERTSVTFFGAPGWDAREAKRTVVDPDSTPTAELPLLDED